MQCNTKLDFNYNIMNHLFMLRKLGLYSKQQNIMDRTVDIVFSCRVILETVHFIIYVLVSAPQLFFAK